MRRTALSLSLAASLAACAGSPEDPSATLTRVATAPAGDLTVALLARAPGLGTGMETVYLRLTTASGQAVTDADVTFMPEMAMSGGPTHGAPVIGSPAVGADGLYRVDVVFQMPSSPMATWRATVGVARPGSPPAEATFSALAVTDSGRARTFSWLDPETAATAKLVSSLNFLAPPRVGLNPVIVTLHRMDGMTFAPISDAAMALHPWMVDMMHGAEGSVDPTPIDTCGRYAGQLAFSMRGAWETTVTITRGEYTLPSPKFTTRF